VGLRFLFRLSQTLFIDACKNNVRASLFRANLKKRFVSGHDFSRATKAANEEGFSPGGAISLSVRLRPAFDTSTGQQDITRPAFFSPWGMLSCPIRLFRSLI
jgi:hypothetical protein